MKNLSQSANYKWYILILGGLTNAVVVAVPSMGLSVLLPEISKDLNLSLIQAGLVWGIGALPLIVGSLLAGTLGDKFGPKRILTLSCLLLGLVGALRGFSTNFLTLTGMVFLFGLIAPLITLSNIKSAGNWFETHQLGFANGVLSMGMALGFLVGSMVSATMVSPWLGGWRNVFFLYGAVAAVFGIPWYLSQPSPEGLHAVSASSTSMSLRQSMGHVASLRNMWLLGFAILGVGGSIQGLLGYLPLYLRGLGWPENSADGALAAFHTISMIFVLPITLWSDRLGSRKKILIGAALFTSIGIGLLSSVNGGAIWGAVIAAGLVRDGFMALFLTMILETRGVGRAYSGTATGFVMIFMGIGSLLAPPLGNSLAGLAPGAPFIFWAALTVFGSVCMSLTSESDPALDSRIVAPVSQG